MDHIVVDRPMGGDPTEALNLKNDGLNNGFLKHINQWYLDFWLTRG